MPGDQKPMGFFEALWAVVGGLLILAMFGLFGWGLIVLGLLIAYFGGGTLYLKYRLARQRRQRRQGHA